MLLPTFHLIELVCFFLAWICMCVCVSMCVYCLHVCCVCIWRWGMGCSRTRNLHHSKNKKNTESQPSKGNDYNNYQAIMLSFFIKAKLFSSNFINKRQPKKRLPFLTWIWVFYFIISSAEQTVIKKMCSASTPMLYRAVVQYLCALELTQTVVWMIHSNQLLYNDMCGTVFLFFCLLDMN